MYDNDLHDWIEVHTEKILEISPYKELTYQALYRTCLESITIAYM